MSLQRFAKYQALGNDFVVLDRRATGLDLDPQSAIRLCDRRLGIGADGVLVLLPDPIAAARMVVHNADGSVAEMCGNGLRCAARHLAEEDPARPGTLLVQTGAGPLECRLTYREGRVEEVEVAMGPARLVASQLPSGPDGGPFIRQPLPEAPGLLGTAVSLGNPHLVLFDRPPGEAAVLGPRLERSALFPERTNVEWVRPTGEGLAVVVWERGCGLTRACGTGACAALAAAVVEGRAEAERWTPVDLPGGRLLIHLARDLGQVRMRGPATYVFGGTVGLG